MSRPARGAWLAALLTASIAQADVLTLVASGVTPAAGSVVKSWAMSLGPGSITGKVNGSSITFSQDVIDEAMVNLLRAHGRQTILPSVVLEARATVGGPVLYRLTLTNAKVTSLDVSDPGLSASLQAMQWSVKAASLRLELVSGPSRVPGTLSVDLE